MPARDDVVRAEGVQKSYRPGGREVSVLEKLDLSVGRGEFLAIMGLSGCGKTTLLNCLSGLDVPDLGRIWVDGLELSALSDRRRTQQRGKTMGFVFQSFNLVPVLTATQNVALPLQLAGVGHREATRRAFVALAAVGVDKQAEQRPLEMSGGQQQRVAIARALVNEPLVVWADEPTGNLDSGTSADVMDLFSRLNRERGTAFVIVTHDGAVAERAHRIVHMDSGRIVRERGLKHQ